MAIANMKKLTLAVANSVKNNVLEDLQTLGAVHIDHLRSQSEENILYTDSWTQDLSQSTVDVSLLEDQRKEIATALTRLKELFHVSLPEFEITSSDKIQDLRSKYNIQDLTQELHHLDHQTKEYSHNILMLEHEIAEINKWAHVVDNFDPIHHQSKVLTGTIGHISEVSLENLRVALKQETLLADVLVAWVADKEAYCYIVSSPDVWNQVGNILKEHPFHILSVTRRSGDTHQMLSDMHQELEKAKQIYNNCILQWEKYSHMADELALLHDILEMDAMHQRSLGCSLETEQVSFFRTWVPELLLPKVVATLSIYEKSIDLTIDDPAREEYEFVPVSLKNNNITGPFAVLTNMYGTPKYGATVDPTPHLSVFYFIYYGICLGDAIYGLVMALFSSWMMFKNRANQNMANFYALLAWSGLSAVIAGVLFGSYAGDLLSTYIPIPFLNDIRFTFSDGSGFFDKPLFVLFISLLLGGIQLWYGYWIKFFLSIKNNGIILALMNELPWLILLAGFFGWAIFDWIASLAGLVLMTDSLRNIMFLLMQIGAGLILLSATVRGFQKSFGSGVVGPLAGAWELYSISGYLSNLLSYARLLALGLSSGIIANVFNQLGLGMIESLASVTPVLSVFGITLLIFLHVFNLVLGGFGAFVHALRLQFVEFFGQFMEGGGKEYQPLQCKGSHYTVR